MISKRKITQKKANGRNSEFTEFQKANKLVIKGTERI